MRLQSQFPAEHRQHAVLRDEQSDHGGGRQTPLLACRRVHQPADPAGKTLITKHVAFIAVGSASTLATRSVGISKDPAATPACRAAVNRHESDQRSADGPRMRVVSILTAAGMAGFCGPADFGPVGRPGPDVDTAIAVPRSWRHVRQRRTARSSGRWSTVMAAGRRTVRLRTE